ncbi:ferredoxin [Pseudomonas sp. GCM10022188]|uniref:(2Fe-2S) ferredoxin domain-containing protein n=1 Tax=Pseudomonas TaxID=286 RepID=UPI001E5CBB07|nr:(2Fe-2S) ferredoxin domain-containing protein [Pseudomonas oryzagri]MCC6077154.1 (2Fe-2S) ferredoxin domain-containing protein [Pseudomonas oryzagri]
MSTSPYARVLFVGPDLARGSFAELFQRELSALRGAAALADIVDTTEGYAGLWQRVRDCIAAGELPLLLVDLDPNASSPYLDWLRSELQAIGEGVADRLFVASSDAGQLDAVCALIEQPERHLGCVEVPALPAAHAWSCIPQHHYRVLLCNGPRCIRRGALPLWKTLRERLKAAGRLECEGGVHLTRTQCQFPCDQGPTLSVYPAGTWYRVSSEDDVQRLVQEQFVEGREVVELIMRQM